MKKRGKKNGITPKVNAVLENLTYVYLPKIYLKVN